MKKLITLIAVLLWVIGLSGTLSAFEQHPGVANIFMGNPRFFYYDLDIPDADLIQIRHNIGVENTGSVGECRSGPIVTTANLSIISPTASIVGNAGHQVVSRSTYFDDNGNSEINIRVQDMWFDLYDTPSFSPYGAYEYYIPYEITVDVIYVEATWTYHGCYVEYNTLRNAYTNTGIIAKSGPSETPDDFHYTYVSPQNDYAFNNGVTMGLTYLNDGLSSYHHLHYASDYTDAMGNNTLATQSAQFSPHVSQYIFINYALHLADGAIVDPGDIQYTIAHESDTWYYFTWHDVLNYQGFATLSEYMYTNADPKRYITGFIPLTASGFGVHTPYMRRVVSRGQFHFQEPDNDLAKLLDNGLTPGLWQPFIRGVQFDPFAFIWYDGRSNAYITSIPLSEMIFPFSTNRPNQYPLPIGQSIPVVTAGYPLDFNIPHRYTHFEMFDVWDGSFGGSVYGTFNNISSHRYNEVSNRLFFHHYPSFTGSRATVPVIISYYDEIAGLPSDMTAYPIHDIYLYSIERPGLRESVTDPGPEGALLLFLHNIGWGGDAGHFAFFVIFMVGLSIPIGLAPLPFFAQLILIGGAALLLAFTLGLPVWFTIPLVVFLILAGLSTLTERGGHT